MMILSQLRHLYFKGVQQWSMDYYDQVDTNMNILLGANKFFVL